MICKHCLEEIATDYEGDYYHIRNEYICCANNKANDYIENYENGVRATPFSLEDYLEQALLI